MSTTPTFTTLNPASGDELGSFAIHSDDQVNEVVDAARIAAAWWAGLGHRERAIRLVAFKGVLTRRMDQLAWLVHREGGKPVDDALLEILFAIEHLDWATKNARGVLGERRVSPGVLGINNAATLAYEPLGVVGVIGPWNYPVFTPMGSIAYALAAGNAVVFKPSEYTPAVGAWIVDAFRSVVPEHPVLSLVTGYGETGASLCRSGVDKISFTGSAATARKVMATCAESLTPVLLECGGKDALIVDADADLDKAADAATYGGYSNAGQTCVAVERVYVVDAVADEFIARLKSKVSVLTAGDAPTSSYGPMTMPSQINVVRSHVADAVARGGNLVVGREDPIRDGYIDPVLLTDVPEDSIAMTDETFGPVVIVNRVGSLAEAVDRANATSYGLAASIFGRSKAVTEAARSLRVGMVSINSWVTYAGVPSLPWGGVGDSGFGRIHGADGLREFARAKSVVRERFSSPLKVASFDRTAATLKNVATLTSIRHGKRNWLS